MASVLENCFSFSLFEVNHSWAVVFLFCFPWWLIHSISMTPSSCSLMPLIKHSEVAVIALAAKIIIVHNYKIIIIGLHWSCSLVTPLLPPVCNILFFLRWCSFSYNPPVCESQIIQDFQGVRNFFLYVPSFILRSLLTSFIVCLAFHSSFPCLRHNNCMTYGELWIKVNVNHLLFYPFSSRQSSLVALCTCRDFTFLSFFFFCLPISSYLSSITLVTHTTVHANCLPQLTVTCMPCQFVIHLQSCFHT